MTAIGEGFNKFPEKIGKAINGFDMDLNADRRSGYIEGWNDRDSLVEVDKDKLLNNFYSFLMDRKIKGEPIHWDSNSFAQYIIDFLQGFKSEKENKLKE